MAKILQFYCRETEDADAQTAGREGMTAEIIVFPGVRYERWGEPGGADAELGADENRDEGCERDRLELAE